MKKEKELSATVAIGLVCNVAINLVLIPKYSSIGAAIGTVVSELIKTILQIFIVKADISVNAFVRNAAKYSLFSAIMGAVIYTLNVCIFSDKTIFNTFALLAAGGAIYGVCLLAEIYVSRKTQQ